MDLLPSSPVDLTEEMAPPPVPSIVIDKGKGREEQVDLSSPAPLSKWGRDRLSWDDLAELVTPHQTRSVPKLIALLS
jgi:hypothetical protein